MPPQLPTCQSETYSGPDEPTGAYIYFRARGARRTSAYLWLVRALHLTSRLFHAIYH